jgi:hypothetical protein
MRNIHKYEYSKDLMPESVLTSRQIVAVARDSLNTLRCYHIRPSEKAKSRPIHVSRKSKAEKSGQLKPFSLEENLASANAGLNMRKKMPTKGSVK